MSAHTSALPAAGIQGVTLVGKILAKRYVVLEEVGRDGDGDRFLVYDMNELKRTHVRVSAPARADEEPSFELVDADTPLVASSRPAAGKSGAKPSAPSEPRSEAASGSSDGSPSPRSPAESATAPGSDASEAPSVESGDAAAAHRQDSMSPAPLLRPVTDVSPAARPGGDATPTDDAGARPQLLHAITAPGSRPLGPSAGAPDPRSLPEVAAPTPEPEDRAEHTQPLDLSSVEEMVASVDEAPLRERVKTGAIEAAWFAQKEWIEQEETSDDDEGTAADHAALIMQAAKLTAEEYRKYALELSPPPPPTAGTPASTTERASAGPWATPPADTAAIGRVASVTELPRSIVSPVGEAPQKKDGTADPDGGQTAAASRRPALSLVPPIALPRQSLPRQSLPRQKASGTLEQTTSPAGDDGRQEGGQPVAEARSDSTEQPSEPPGLLPPPPSAAAGSIGPAGGAAASPPPKSPLTPPVIVAPEMGQPSRPAQASPQQPVATSVPPAPGQHAAPAASAEGAGVEPTAAQSDALPPAAQPGALPPAAQPGARPPAAQGALPPAAQPGALHPAAPTPAPGAPAYPGYGLQQGGQLAPTAGRQRNYAMIAAIFLSGLVTGLLAGLFVASMLRDPPVVSPPPAAPSPAAGAAARPADPSAASSPRAGAGHSDRSAPADKPGSSEPGASGGAVHGSAADSDPAASTEEAGRGAQHDKTTSDSAKADKRAKAHRRRRVLSHRYFVRARRAYRHHRYRRASRLASHALRLNRGNRRAARLRARARSRLRH